MKINQYFLLFVVFLLGMLFSRVIGSNLIEGDENKTCGDGATWYNDSQECRCNGWPDAIYDSKEKKCKCLDENHVYRKSSGFCYPENCKWDNEKKECICPEGQKYDLKRGCVALRSPDQVTMKNTPDCVKWSDGCKMWQRKPIPFGYTKWKKANNNNKCDAYLGNDDTRYPYYPYIVESCHMDVERLYDEEKKKQNM